MKNVFFSLILVFFTLTLAAANNSHSTDALYTCISKHEIGIENAGTVYMASNVIPSEFKRDSKGKIRPFRSRSAGKYRRISKAWCRKNCTKR